MDCPIEERNMPGFFYNLGKMVGPKVRQANRVVSSLTGRKADVLEGGYAVGRDLAQAFAQQMELERNPQLEQWLDALGARLAEHLARRPPHFCFRVVRSGEVNAFALPGGFIFLTLPLLEVCQWDNDETAFV